MQSDVTEVASPRRLWAWAFAIAVVGMVVRALWYLHFKEDIPIRMGEQGDLYSGQAKSILNGSISNPNALGLATSAREYLPPGYALFMAGLWSVLPRGDVFRSPDWVLLVVFAAQWLLAGITTLMTFAISRRVLFGWSALAPPLILTFSIGYIDLSNTFANETLLAFLLTATVLLLMKAHSDNLPEWGERYWQDEKPPHDWQWLSCVGAGMALSAAVLVEPRMLVLLPFATWWLVRAARGRYAVLFLVFSILLPGAWMARNYDQFHTLLVPISIQPEAALYQDNANPADGNNSLLEAAPACNPVVLNSPDLEQHIVWGHCMLRAGTNQIVDNPGRALRAIPDRLAALYSPWDPEFARGTYQANLWGYQALTPRSLRTDPNVHTARQVLAVVLMVLYALMALVGIAALWLEGPGSQARMIAIPLITLPLFFLLFHAENRFRLPMLPLLAVAITLGALTTWEAFADARRK